MPNWCENQLVMSGPLKSVEAVLSGMKTIDENGKEQLKLLEPFIPLPDSLEDNEWYTWCNENWGTKWDIHSPSIVKRFFSIEEIDGNRESIEFIRIDFDTAWSPPEAGIITISKMFPDVVFFLYYIEYGMDFQGFIRVMNGQVLNADHVNTIIPDADVYINTHESWDDSFLTNEEIARVDDSFDPPTNKEKS